MPDENILANIEPETREETFLQDIADGTQTLTPAVRKEEFLRRIAAKPGVPSASAEDAGKVLTVGDLGSAYWADGPLPLPLPSGYGWFLRKDVTEEEPGQGIPVIRWGRPAMTLTASAGFVQALSQAAASLITTLVGSGDSSAFTSTSISGFPSDFLLLARAAEYSSDSTPVYFNIGDEDDPIVYLVTASARNMVSLGYFQAFSTYLFRVDFIFEGLVGDYETDPISTTIVVQKI